MIDREFEKRGEAMSNNLDTTEPIEVDMEYTLGDFPALTAEQIYANYDARGDVAKLRAELEQVKQDARALARITRKAAGLRSEHEKSLIEKYAK